MNDVLIVGGGVIGLSIAYELAERGAQVCVLDRGELGREASWAGAGILPPAKMSSQATAYQQLAALCYQLHPAWAEKLQQQTAIDTGFRRTGGLYLAWQDREAKDLEQAAQLWQQQQIAVEKWDAGQLAHHEPLLADGLAGQGLRLAHFLPEECQLRNPHHLQALVAACRMHDVELLTHCEVNGFEFRRERMTGVRTNSGKQEAENFVLTAGAWSAELGRQLGVELALKPIRGQMVLLKSEPGRLRHIINVGPRYLVPREDGRILAGSTEEDVGFVKENTPDGVAGLIEFIRELAPALHKATFERSWAGLRPNTHDGLPYVGPLPGLGNAWLAAGHFRSGLTLSPGTAVVVASLVLGQTPPFDLSPFRLNRPGLDMASVSAGINYIP